MRGQHIKSTQELLESARPRFRHPLVRLAEEHGYEVVKQKAGDVTEMTNGQVTLRLHFFDKLFLSAYVIESPTRNLGKVKEEGLRGYLEGTLCLSEHEEPWGTQFCKLLAGHDGMHVDIDGTWAA